MVNVPVELFVLATIVVVLLFALLGIAHGKIAALTMSLTVARMRKPPFLISSNFDDVGDFHQKFELENVTHGAAFPRSYDLSLLSFRQQFLQEELDEFHDAWVKNDPEKAFDALLDLVYVAMGTAHLMGFPWQAGWDEVQRANMTKQRSAGDDDPLSKRATKGDVVKPAGWRAPDLKVVLMRHGWTGKKISTPQVEPGV